jgi:hypothetical protein
VAMKASLRQKRRPKRNDPASGILNLEYLESSAPAGPESAPAISQTTV